MQAAMINKRKALLSLDFNNNPHHSSKKQKVRNSDDAPVLCTPDMDKLKLTSTELDELLLEMLHDTQYFPDSGHLPEIYLDSFVGDSSMENRDNIVTETLYSDMIDVESEIASLSSDSDMQSSFFMFYNSKSEEEMLMPLDVEYQEKLKMERKREKNRLAATKCRTKKLETIEMYNKRVLDLKSQNQQLEDDLTALKDTVRRLQIKVAMHVNIGCEMMVCDLI
uniref:BZIP domain-containing protein n=1 Tax=Strigamia maritima TaxID=126957 RepID=T1IYL9_STRMM